ncbi:hypothetical protein [Caudoviricetes sp.]|nr:hypothetical protein [Caudoviricetes sp.]
MKYKILEPSKVNIGVNSLGGAIVTAADLKKAGHDPEALLKAGVIEVFSTKSTKEEAPKES